MPMFRVPVSASLALCAALALTAGLVAVPSTALACGGLFCSVTVQAPAPVDQTAERIIFEVDNGSISAHVQIQYAGEADRFAWVVPVPNTPEVEESHDAYFRELDEFTQLSVTLPQPPTCPGASVPSFGGDDGGGCGCGDFDSASSGPTPTRAPDPNDPVTVHASDFTTNYEFAVISAEQADDLVTWLQDNNYNVSDNMIPAMQPYVDEGMQFLGLKLRDGKDANDIVPIEMTYEGGMPMIPIRLTAVAAQPQMGIQVFVLSDNAFEPANYAVVAPDEETILFDAAGNTNYFDWMARVADEADGRLFVREFLGTTSSLGLASPYQWLGRYTTRISPEDMTLDPVFEPVGAAAPQPATIDLSQRASILCNDFRQPLVTVAEREPSACAFNYCGERGECTVLDAGGESEQVACRCADGDLAQRLTGPDGQPRITCVPSENPFAILASAGGVGTEFDPCNDFDCGVGTCVVKGGFPMCRCGDDLAIATDAGPTCTALGDPAALTFYGPGAGLESQGSTEPLTEDSLRSQRSGLAWWSLMLAGCLLALLGLRHRRQATA